MDKLYAFCAAMAEARAMLEKRLIPDVEYKLISEKLIEKHGLPSNTLFQDIDLISPNFRGNMLD